MKTAEQVPNFYAASRVCWWVNKLIGWFSYWRLGYCEDFRTGRFELWWSNTSKRQAMVPCTDLALNRLAGTRPFFTAVIHVLLSDEIAGNELRQRINQYAGSRLSIVGFYYLMMRMEDAGLVTYRETRYRGHPDPLAKQRLYKLT